MNAIAVDQNDPDRLAVRKVKLVPAAAGDVTVRVTSISLNRGEVKRALTVTDGGTVPGWDFAGVVTNTVIGPEAPKVGDRVVGMVPSGSWAQFVHAPVTSVATIPDGVTDEQGASLPVAGLTALHALRKAGLVLGKKVLVDGASGGVGQFAIQLAAASGARVYSHIRREAQRSLVQSASTGGVIVGNTLEAARASGPYDLIVDSVGGSALAAALTMLRRNGACVTVGSTEGDTVTFNSAAFFRASGTSLLSLILGEEITKGETAGDGLALLLRLVRDGVLKPNIAIEAPWTEISSVARQLIDRGFAGKAVLRVSS
jgi:NADPH:quinone reductase-like Zn-dependent oxidoreductase